MTDICILDARRKTGRSGKPDSVASGSALLIVSAYLLRYDGKNAYRIWRRDRRNHKSPNSAQTESACAGALGLRLAGDAWYFGKLVPKPYIGDEIHPIEPQDIRRVNRLMYGAAGIMGLLALVMRAVILF